MKSDEEFSIAVLYICLKNLIAVAFFCYLAVLFKHWWIILFALVFQTSTKFYVEPQKISSASHSEQVDAIVCDRCGEILVVDDLTDVVHTVLPEYGWTRVQVDGKWITLCNHCNTKMR